MKAFEALQDDRLIQDLKVPVTNLINQWNKTHTNQVDAQSIFDACKRIFNYHKWIQVHDLKITFERGLMGEFGENKGLNDETIFRWFVEYGKEVNKKRAATTTQQHRIISQEQRQKNRNDLIVVFMGHWNHYKKTGRFANLDHYLPIFVRYFKNLGLIDVSEEEIKQLHINELTARKDPRKPPPESTIKKLFLETFQKLVSQDYPIEDKLKAMKL